MNGHLSDDQLIARLYESDGDHSHMDTCAECSARWRALQIRRKELTAPVEVSSATLLAQQEGIFGRLESPAARSWRLSWAPALAVVFLLVVGMFLYRPSPPQPPTPAHTETASESDTQLFTDIYSMEQEVEPRAAAPIHALFEEAQ